MNEVVQFQTEQAPIALPRDALGMMRLAMDLSKATMLPKHFRNPPDLCMALMMLNDMGVRNSILALHEMYIVKEKPFFSGKFLLGLANSSDRFAERLRFEFLGEGDARRIRVTGRLAGEDTPRTLELALEDARTDNTQWDKQPDQQLVYRGATQWLRRHAPELILGMQVEGEIIDVTPPPPEKGTNPLRLNPSATQDERTAAVDAQYADNLGTTVSEQNERVPDVIPSPAQLSATVPHQIKRADDSEASWKAFTKYLLAAVEAAPDIDVMNAWTTENADNLVMLEKTSASLHKWLIDRIRHNIAARDERDAT